MIRHLNSFFISVCIHLVVFILIFFILKDSISFEKKINEKRTSVTLSHIIIKKEKRIQKKESKKKNPKVVKKNPKVVKKKVIKKKVVKKKIIKKKIIKKKIIKKVIKKENIEVSNIKEPTKDIIKKIQKEPKEPKTKQIEIKQSNSIKKEKQLLEDEKIALQIRQMLEENKYYPKKARRRGIEGIVNVEFILTKTGKVISLKLISNHNILIKSLKKTISNISNNFPKPNSDLTFRIPIKFSLKR